MRCYFSTLSTGLLFAAIPLFSMGQVVFEEDSAVVYMGDAKLEEKQPQNQQLLQPETIVELPMPPAALVIQAQDPPSEIIVKPSKSRRITKPPLSNSTVVFMADPPVNYKGDMEPLGFDITRKGMIVPIDLRKKCRPLEPSISGDGQVIRGGDKEEHIAQLLRNIKEESRFSSAKQVEQLYTLSDSVKQGDSHAMDEIANRYYDGRGLPQNMALSFTWYVLAADHGSTYAKYMISEFYGQGWIVDQDPGLSGEWYLAAQKQENAQLAMRELGYRYADREGGLFKEDRAFFWFERAAKKGDVVSQLWLGDYYSDSQHTDGLLALRWYGKAASAKETQAYYGIAQIYEQGLGIPVDYAQAAHWYEKAAHQGLGVAQFHLAELYLLGRGVPKDPVRAWAWLEVSNGTVDNLAVYTQRHKIAAELLLPEQRLPAAQLAAKYRALYSGDRRVELARGKKHEKVPLSSRP